MLRTSLLAAILLALPAPAGALAAPAKAPTIDKSRHLWATVNICDSKQSPDTLGIRASMPGSGRKHERMYMRFRAQYLSPTDNLWHNFVAKGTDSGYRYVGSAKYKARQSGWSFRFDLGKGQRYELRGAVDFEWRKKGDVMRHAAKRTTKGHHVALSEPKGYSAATCVLKGA
jgi:hypothetical protein